jgi:hypothetical protein
VLIDGISPFDERLEMKVSTHLPDSPMVTESASPPREFEWKI